MEVLAAILGSSLIAEAVVFSFNLIRELRPRIEIAFTHAKKRTLALCEAAEFAEHYVQLSCDVYERLGANDKAQIKNKLLELKGAVCDAAQLMKFLNEASKWRWFGYASSYRERMTAHTFAVCDGTHVVDAGTPNNICCLDETFL